MVASAHLQSGLIAFRNACMGVPQDTMDPNTHRSPYWENVIASTIMARTTKAITARYSDTGYLLRVIQRAQPTVSMGKG